MFEHFEADPLVTLENPRGRAPKVTKIDALTPEQHDAIAPWVAKWAKVATMTVGESPTDRDRFRAGATECYRLAGMRHDHLRFAFADSPIACVCVSCMIEAWEVGSEKGEIGKGRVDLQQLVEGIFDLKPTILAGIVRVAHEIIGDISVSKASARYIHGKTRENATESWRSHLGGQFWAPWLAYESFFLEHCGLDLGPVNERARAAREAQMSCGWWYISEDFVVASERPKLVHVGPDNTLNCDYEPAIEWIDGWNICRTNGVEVPEWFVRTPAEEIDPTAFAREPNVEIRREIVRKIGVERLIQKLGSRIIDQADGPDGRPMYELHMVDLKGETGEFPCLKMRNPSIGVYHMEFVPRGTTTVQEALDFRMGGKFIHRRPLT